jgi:Uncharacterized protein conserved in bacteria (DUF2332)
VRGASPSYERLAASVAADDELLGLLGTLPPAKRQPNLLFGVVRLLGGPVDDPVEFHDFTVRNWPVSEIGWRSVGNRRRRPSTTACSKPGNRELSARVV